ELDVIVNAKCTHPASLSTSAASPPSTQVSAEPSPTFNLKRWVPAAPFSLKNLNPEDLSFCVSGNPALSASSGPTTIIPALSGLAFTLYHMVALNSSVNNPAEGRVR